VSNSFQAGDFKVLRGGSFQQDLLAARSADRYWAPPGGRAEMVGRLPRGLWSVIGLNR